MLSPYPYYIKVTSVYGGNETDAYTLGCSFVASSEEDVPDRVKSVFLKPSAIDNLSLEMKPMSEYDGDETPSKTSAEHIKKLEDENLKLRIENAYLKELRRLRLEEETLQKKQRESSTVSEDSSN